MAQRRAFVDLYRGYLLDGIASRLGASEGIEKVAVLRSEQARGDSMVSTEIGLGPGQPPMRVDLRVRPVGGGYRIVDVVAEGVETEEQAELLASMDCSHAQGYYFSRPVAAADATAMLLCSPFLKNETRNASCAIVA